MAVVGNVSFFFHISPINVFLIIIIIMIKDFLSNSTLLLLLASYLPSARPPPLELPSLFGSVFFFSPSPLLFLRNKSVDNFSPCIVLVVSSSVGWSIRLFFHYIYIYVYYKK
ncbi:hypothetical protein BDA99DRAFT_125378 [Phascolomyces articulosus]|uniref:Uncharacterized protein n=1 Tax=Phascolomyces articulosus TaxID=60185 RepID=A0AAD5PLH3_9FUNG|nr:hypothetical protein BDA99DRAFT_125378 [Phascolomyces articulosus]